MIAVATLSLVQASCLQEAAKGPIYRSRAGWGRNGWHTPGTVTSLVRRGLLTETRLEGSMGAARITKAGRAWLRSLEIAS